jgi:hypothetical protein
MDIKIVIYLLLVHFIADFVLQTNEQASRKSTSIWYLLEHTISYSLTFWLAIGIVEGFTMKALEFYGITFVLHTATDYVTSRGTKKLWGNVTKWADEFTKTNYRLEYVKVKHANAVHNFFILIGFDQFLHFTQLMLTYYLLF